MKYAGYSWIIFLLLLAACDTGSQRRINREALQEEMRNREPKRLTEAQIDAEAYRQGRLIAEAAQENLLSTLKKVMEQEGTEGALAFCRLQALPLTDSLSEAYGARIRRTSLKLRNPANAPDSLEQLLLEAYQYNAEEDLPMADNVQAVGRKYLLYTKPIVLGSELCLNCHGQPNEEIAPETLHLLDSLYPHDKARNFNMGDLRGIWSIRFKKKDIVNAL